MTLLVNRFWFWIELWNSYPIGSVFLTVSDSLYAGFRCPGKWDMAGDGMNLRWMSWEEKGEGPQSETVE